MRQFRDYRGWDIDKERECVREMNIKLGKGLDGVAAHGWFI